MKRIDKKIKEWKKIESKLQVGDIILVKETKIYSKIIRKVTKSHWSHAVLVFFIPTKKMPFKNILVVGAETHGIEIHRIQKFTQKFKENYDLGVKRIPDLSNETKERALSFMFNNVDIPYDYIRLLAFLLSYITNKLKGKKDDKHLKKYLVNKDAFICSSFIQKAFFEAMPKDKKKSTLFTNKKDTEFFMEETTPADIARSKNSKWIYNPHR